MRHAYAVVYTIEKDDGTAFDELTMNENGAFNLFLEGGGSINALTALRLGVKGGYGSSYTFDADPSDNAIQLVEMMSLTGSDSSLVGETLHFDTSKLLYFPEGKQADGRDLPAETLATGDWSMSFKIDYEDLSVDLPAGQTFTVNGNNAVMNELAISPLGADVTYTVDALDGPSEPTGLETNSESRAGYGNFSVTFTDGTTEEIGSGYGSWQEGDKNRRAEDLAFRPDPRCRRYRQHHHRRPDNPGRVDTPYGRATQQLRRTRPRSASPKGAGRGLRCVPPPQIRDSPFSEPAAIPQRSRRGRVRRYDESSLRHRTPRPQKVPVPHLR